MYRLFLRDVSVDARIGVHDFERAGAQTLLVNVELFLVRRGDGDEITAVLDYDAVREAVLWVAAERHWELQESFCEAVITRIGRPDGLVALFVSTAKPDVYADVARVGCAMAWASAAFDPAAASLLRAA